MKLEKEFESIVEPHEVFLWYPRKIDGEWYLFEKVERQFLPVIPNKDHEHYGDDPQFLREVAKKQFLTKGRKSGKFQYRVINSDSE